MPPKKAQIGFKYSIQGIRIAWMQEFNFKLHVCFAVVALLFSWFFKISTTELLFVIFAIGFVMTAEIFNTALEELCDKFQPEHDPHIGKIKDLAAAAVLISSLVAVVIGLIIFAPHVTAFLS